jgi:hypothetical protein
MIAKRGISWMWKQAIPLKIPLFGLCIGLMSISFHLTMCILRRMGNARSQKRNDQGKDSDGKAYAIGSVGINQKQAAFIAGLISALPLAIGLDDKEQNLLKLFIFPLAIRCICDKMFEIGWLPKVKYGSIIGYMLASTIISYGFTIERHSQPASMYRMVDSYAKLTDVEDRFLNIFKT